MTEPGEPGDDVGTESEPVRRAEDLEELVARTHERAAELYESRLRRRGGVGPPELEHRARMHRELASMIRSVGHLTERTVGGFEARVEVGAAEAGAARALVVLSALDRLRLLVVRRIEERVVVCRREGASWAQIAAALGVSRQTAHARFRRHTR